MSASQKFRLDAGGEIDRSKPLEFTFDGCTYQGYQGDTLASALLANGVHLVARSFKYHRPRGIYSAGVEEPNALISLRTGGRTEPNTRATSTELFPGLLALSQNRWPGLKFDVMSINNVFARFMPAGFYYKTFMWPAKGWMFYERIIRKAAGMGEAARLPDPDQYEHKHVHCDLLIAGSGPTGLMAALTAARSGARILLMEQDFQLGGSLLSDEIFVDGQAGSDWAKYAEAQLQAMPNVIIVTRCTVAGHHDHNVLNAVERVSDHLPQPGASGVRQRLWTIRAKQSVIAAGAIERPLVFPGNDKPGVMLSSAVRTYVKRYAILPGKTAVVFGNNDTIYATAITLHGAGVKVAAVVDTRPDVSGELKAQMNERAIEVMSGHGIASVSGYLRVNGVKLSNLREPGTVDHQIDCDLICVSGGFNPTLHLSSHAGSRPVFDAAKRAFVPGEPSQNERCAGAAAGSDSLAECVVDGIAAANAAAKALGFAEAEIDAPAVSGDYSGIPDSFVAMPVEGKAFVDIQDDVTSDDVALASREGFKSVEHLKRYTTLGMGADQGKTSNYNGLSLLADARQDTIPQVGTTTFRPPYTPISFGTLGGDEAGEHFSPLRLSAMHDWHVEAGAVFVDAAGWQRPQFYPQKGETQSQAIRRETKAVRERVGLIDVSTLGKIDVQGPDAGELLERVYINHWKKLAIGKVRYGLMLREDGHGFDDGTSARISENRYHLTTTTAYARQVMQHLEFCLQVLWPELKVQINSTTDQWAAIAVAGPQSRALLAKVMDDLDVSNEGLPYMSFAEGHLCGMPARVFRISFSGELAYEVNVPANYGLAAWKALIDAGETYGVLPYGMEAMGNMRIEKGFLTHSEVDGRVTAADLGMAGMMSKKKDFIGKAMAQRPGLIDAERPSLVGFVPVDGASRLRSGAQIIDTPDAKALSGNVSSSGFSPTLGHSIALGFVTRGNERKGETVYAAYPLRDECVEVKIVDPVFIDPEGERLRG